MKLLEKQQVSSLKAKERKTEIDEGAKLARRVDALREMASKEQAILTKFREETAKVIQEDIDTLIRQRDNIKREIAEAQTRLRYLQTLLGKILLINNK